MFRHSLIGQRIHLPGLAHIPVLTKLARQVATGRALETERSQLAGALLQERGNFVTLTQGGMLRGCIGSIKPAHCLAQSVAVNAFNAAFNDSRFAPLSAAETGRTRIEISVLSRPEPINVSTHEE